jgi:anti-sigma B factor antagonist
MVYKLDMLRAPGALNKDDLNRSFVYLLHLSGNFVMEVSDEFNLLMTTLITGGMKKVVFDLGDLKYIDSTGIGIIINVTKQVRAKGGDLVFFNVNPKILEIFQLVKLNDFILFFKGEKQITDHFFTTKA